MRPTVWIIIFCCALVAISMALPSATAARTGGPDTFGYTFKDSDSAGGPGYGWIDITSTGTMVLQNITDNQADGIPVGFYFNYYGYNYSQVSIARDGYIYLSDVDYGYIAPFWHDFYYIAPRVAVAAAEGVKAQDYGTPSGAVYYETIGTAPDRLFVVEWFDIPNSDRVWDENNSTWTYVSSPSTVTFEAILHEGTNDILFQYDDVDFGVPELDNGSGAWIGIQEGWDRSLQYSANEPVVHAGQAILFKYPGFTGVDLAVSKSAPASMARGNAMAYTLHYRNIGNLPADAVTLRDVLPAGVAFVSASDGGIYNASTGIVTWDLGQVSAFPSGAGARTVTVSIPDSTPVGTEIFNTVSIDSGSPETDYADNNATISTKVTGGTILPPGVSVVPIHGVDDSGVPLIYWLTPITFSYNNTSAMNVSINIHFDDEGGSDIAAPMEQTSPGNWTYTVTFYPRHGHITVTYIVDGVPIVFSLYVDPAGYVYDTVTGERIAGATVWLQRPAGLGTWENVPVGQDPAVMDPDVNPQVTGVDGQFAWLTLDGCYRVHVEADGYYPADSIAVVVPPAVTDLNVGLTPMAESDTTAPVTVAEPSGTAGNNGWYVSDVSVSLSADDDDGGSGVKVTEYSYDGTGWSTYTVPLAIIGEGNTTVFYRSSDNAGNVETAKSLTVGIDKTPPSVTGAPATLPNANNWYNADVVVHFSASDGVSGIDSLTPDVTLSAEGASRTVTGTATDKAGNSNAATVSGINLDKTPPQVSIAVPADGGSYVLGLAVTASWSATDSLSGIASSQAIPGNVLDTTTVGPKGFTVKATDMAGNEAARTAAYSVNYDFLGFIWPIKDDNTSTFKRGTIVPVMFQLADANGKYVGTADADFTYTLVSGGAGTRYTGNGFWYIPWAHSYVSLLNTRGMAAGTYRLDINLDDGTVKSVLIKIKN